MTFGLGFLVGAVVAAAAPFAGALAAIWIHEHNLRRNAR